MKKNKIIANNVEESPPKKLKRYGSTLNSGMINWGILVIEVAMIVIIRFVNNKPNP